MFRALHQYLGVGVGEHLGYLFTGIWSVLIGVGRGLSVMAFLIASQGVVRGEMADLLFRAVALVHLPIELVGIFLLGFAAGGIRTRLGIAIVALGFAVAAGNTVWYVTSAIPSA